MLKMMFLQRYNPLGKTKREQLQPWNILSFDPKNTDVDEHIDLINTLGDMVDQKEEAKMEKFIETMPTMIQTQYSQRQFQNYRYQRGASQQNRTQYGNNHKPYFQENQSNNYRGQSRGRGPQHFRGHSHGRANYQSSNGAYQYQ